MAFVAWRKWKLGAVLAVVAVALLVTGSAQARVIADAVDSGIELQAGVGRAVLSLRGAALGSVDRGRITVTVRQGDPSILVQGYDWQRPSPDGGTIYGGRDMRFRVFRGAWRIVLNGTGIDTSAVGRGTVGLRGTEGLYSLGGGAFRAWPEEYESIRLGPANTGPRSA
jgi:hypothetical protein